MSALDSGSNRLVLWDRGKQTLGDLSGAANLPSLKDDLARSFAEDRAGNIWVGFNTGLARYRDGAFTFFTTKAGLPPGPINYIYTAHAGRLWLALSLTGLPPDDDPPPERPAFLIYTTPAALSTTTPDLITEDLSPPT